MFLYLAYDVLAVWWCTKLQHCMNEMNYDIKYKRMNELNNMPIDVVVVAMCVYIFAVIFFSLYLML